MRLFQLTILLAAFLLFQVELIVGKRILPWFGGASAVWITSMLFFQVTLLAGYFYGHLLNGVRPRKKAMLHCLLLIASFLVLFVQFSPWRSSLVTQTSWKAQGHGNPFAEVFTVLAVSIGLPFLALASTAPLLQSWWRQLYPHSSPYRLYAVSNFGSLLGLLSYPFLVEPFLYLRTQARLWTWAYVAFTIACAYCAFRMARPQQSDLVSELNQQAEGNAISERPGGLLPALWLALAACASAMFLATTNQLCKNVAPVPLLWVLPLVVYLMSFILCFEGEGHYFRKWFHPLFAGAAFLACFVLAWSAVRGMLLLQIVLYSLVLFVVCMVCHGELALLKPDPRYLTLFYMAVATGGALGGLFVGLLAPYLFHRYWEYQTSLIAAAILVFLIVLRDRNSWLYSPQVRSPLLLLGVAALLPLSSALAINAKEIVATLPPVGAAVIGILLVYRKQRAAAETERLMALVSCAVVLVVFTGMLFILGKASRASIFSIRNFYGALTVEHLNPDDPQRETYALQHGGVVHGFEFHEPKRQRIPTSYYSTDSGLGLLFANHLPLESRRIGIIGLGVGTTAAYARKGDYFRFYEINPAVVRLAFDAQYFHYLTSCPARVEIVLGDARLSLEEELQKGGPQNFDLLVVDAFSGDAIPMHLLTEEAFHLYFGHLKNTTGILAVHVTNGLLDLRPVVGAAAERLGAASVWVHNKGDDLVSTSSDWVLVSRDQVTIDRILTSAKHAAKLQDSESHLWTDDYSNLFQTLLR